jgi:uncharacterized repeat protein (TIGR03943 family)
MAQPTPTRPPRPINYAALTDVLLLSGTGALLTVKWMRGALDFYIHPRYTVLVLLAALVLFLMGGARLRDLFAPRAGQRLTTLHLLLALPLLLGVLVPAQPLGADTLAGRGLDLTNAPLLSQQAVEGDPIDWNLLEWTTALSLRGDELRGEPVDVVGFVFQDERVGRDAFYVARYVITCCAADGAAAGLPVQWPDGDTLPTNTWVRVQGTLATTTIGDGQTIPAVAADSVEPIEQPESPYLFP